MKDFKYNISTGNTQGNNGYLPEAIQMAAKIENEVSQARAMAKLTPLLPKSLLQDVLQSAQEMNFETWEAEDIANLAFRQVEVGHLNQIFETVQAIRDEEHREVVLIKLASQLVRHGYPQDALMAVQAIENEEVRTQQLADLISQLSGLSSVTLHSLWRRTLRILSSNTRPTLLSDLSNLATIALVLGEPKAAGEICRAVLKVGNWWP